jgi:hypothetical protein
VDVHHLWLWHEDDLFSVDQVWMDTPGFDRQGTLVIFCHHWRRSHKCGTSRTHDLGHSGEIAHMSRQPPYQHSDTVKELLYTGVEVPTPALEDKTEQGIPRKGVMQHPQHVVEEGEMVKSSGKYLLTWKLSPGMPKCFTIQRQTSTSETGGLLPPITAISAKSMPHSSSTISGEWWTTQMLTNSLR